MQVLRGVVIARDFGHVQHRAAPPNPPPPLLRCVEDTICDPFEDRQIVQLMGIPPLPPDIHSSYIHKHKTNTDACSFTGALPQSMVSP